MQNKRMVKRYFGVVYAMKTNTLGDRLTQVGRTSEGKNNTIAVFTNPFYTEHEFRRKPSNLIDIDRILEEEWL